MKFLRKQDKGKGAKLELDPGQFLALEEGKPQSNFDRDDRLELELLELED